MKKILKKILNEAKKHPQIEIIERNDYTLLVSFVGLKTFILLCDELDIAILGLEGIYFDGKNVVPSLAHIADFSLLIEKYKNWNQLQKESIQASIEFVQNVPSEGLYYIPSVIAQEEIGSLREETNLIKEKIKLLNKEK